MFNNLLTPNRAVTATIVLISMVSGMLSAGVTDFQPPADTIVGEVTEGVYRIQNVATGRYLTSADRIVTTTENRTGQNREWGFHLNDDDFYNLDSRFSGRGMLDAEPDGRIINSPTEPTSNAPDKSWEFVALDSNRFHIFCREEGRDFLTNNEDNTVGYSTDRSLRSQWTLLLVSPNLTVSTDDRPVAYPELQASPNPSDGSDVLVSGLGNRPVAIDVIDNSGRTVFSQAASLPLGGQLRLSVATLPKGTYYLHVTGDAGVSTLKLIR